VKMPSEIEIMRIFEALSLKNEEDRLNICLLCRNDWANVSELSDNDYYSIQLSANSRVQCVEDNCNAKLEGSSRRG